MGEPDRQAVATAAQAIHHLTCRAAELPASCDGATSRDFELARAAVKAAAPHILADFSKRTAGMAVALNSAAAIIEDRDRQLTRVRKFADGTLHEGGELQEALLKILDGDGNG